jgi:hypothetical protein
MPSNSMANSAAFLSGAGVACLSGPSCSDLEDAEVPKLDSSFLHQRFDNPVEDPLHDVLGLRLSDARSLGNLLGHVFLGHGSPSLAAENELTDTPPS